LAGAASLENLAPSEARATCRYKRSATVSGGRKLHWSFRYSALNPPSRRFAPKGEAGLSLLQQKIVARVARYGDNLAMDEFALSLRQARPADAADLARIYIESWQDTYAGILPHALLAGMSLKGHTGRWRHAIKTGGVLVAEGPGQRVIGLASLGPARDRGLGLDGEIYTLYVDPGFLGHGAGTGLLHGAFTLLKDRKFHSCLVWSHARNNACFFYEAMGGQRVGERITRLGGSPVPEIAFGWKRLAVQPRRIAI